MARGKSPERIRQEIETLQEELRKAEEREAKRIGLLAIQEGLDKLDLSDAELRKAFKDLTSSFRKKGNKSVGGNAPETEAASATG
jgi:hypothetical protein